MKAIITNDQGNVSALKLRLQAEGANDRTLMLLLELQYPMIHRTGCAGGSLPDALEVPVASPGILQLPAGSRLDLCSSPGLEIAGNTTVAIRSDPWEHATMSGARLRIQDPGDWEVVHLILNGRSVPPDGAHDVHPGAIAELKVTLLSDTWKRRTLVAHLEPPDPTVTPSNR